MRFVVHDVLDISVFGPDSCPFCYLPSIYHFVRGCDIGLYYCIWIIYISCIFGRFQRRFCIWEHLF